MTARMNGGIRPDTVFAPFHWGGAACINRLTNPALDPQSRMPSFKVCAVAVVRGLDSRRAGHFEGRRIHA